MTDKEKQQMLKTIEGLMQDQALDVMYSHRLSFNWTDQVTAHFNLEYPCVVWHWQEGGIKVTDFIMKEL